MGASVKKGEAAEFSAKWWKSSQPKGLSSAAKLEQALKAYEECRLKLKSEAGKEALKLAMAALDTVETAAKATATEAGKAKGNAEMATTAQALNKLDFAKERRAGEALVSEEDDGGLADPEQYRDLLRKGLRKLVGSPMNCGFVVGKKPVEHRLVFHRSKSPRGLAAGAAAELGLHVMTFGIAMASED